MSEINEEKAKEAQVRNINGVLEALYKSADVGAPMPQYQCHKKVWALKIKEVNQSPAATVFEGGSYDLAVEEPFAPIQVSAAWVERFKPIAGGYYVVYEDGYKSFSPAEAFESGYTRI